MGENVGRRLCVVLVREWVVGVGVGVCVSGGGKGEDHGPGRRGNAGGDPGRERGSRVNRGSGSAGSRGESRDLGKENKTRRSKTGNHGME